MAHQRTEEWDIDALSQEIHDKTWRGEYWGRNGVIVLARRRFEETMKGEPQARERAAADSAFSSTYYSAAGNAASRFRTAFFLAKPLWAVRALWCRRRAVQLSDAVEWEIGLRGMTPDQLDVRATILRRVGRYEHAMKCIAEALSRPSLRAETEALLLVGKAEILGYTQGPDSEPLAGSVPLNLATLAVIRAVNLVPQVRVQTKVRLWKSIGEHHRFWHHYKEARDAYVQALELAQQAGGMGDQVTKIQALLAQLPK